MKCATAILLALLCATAAMGGSDLRAAPPSRVSPPPAATASVVVNRKALSPETVAMLQGKVGPIRPGRYWYDKVSGLWGKEGGPNQGQIQAGLELGAPLPADISGRGTGIFVNGREIHPDEYGVLKRIHGGFAPGRYW